MSVRPKKWTLLDKDVFKCFKKPGEVVEVRVLNVYGASPAWGGEYARGTVSGYFDDHGAFCEAVRAADKTVHGGIYFTLQVIDPRLLGRAYNRLRPATLTTSDSNVIAYRWLPIDLDPVRPAGVSSSDSELRAALDLRDRVADFAVESMGLPSPIRACSGNGGHLLFQLPDLPANEENKAFVRGMLEEFDAKFSNDEVKIDTTVFNPSRIWKVYGSKARKGDPVPEGANREARPHRQSYIDGLGEFENASDYGND